MKNYFGYVIPERDAHWVGKVGKNETPKLSIGVMITHEEIDGGWAECTAKQGKVDVFLTSKVLNDFHVGDKTMGQYLASLGLEEPMNPVFNKAEVYLQMKLNPDKDGKMWENYNFYDPSFTGGGGSSFDDTEILSLNAMFTASCGGVPVPPAPVAKDPAHIAQSDIPF